MRTLKLTAIIVAVLVIFAACKKKTTPPPPAPTSFTCRGGGLFYSDDSSSVGLPTTFTPNGDGVNDLYAPQHHNLGSYAIEITDAAGTKMFTGTSTDPSGWWDGRYNGNDAPQGYYNVKVDFTSKKAGLKTFSFEITLFRYTPSSGCLKNADVNTCTFGDEIHPRYGFDYYPTAEKVCP